MSSLSDRVEEVLLNASLETELVREIVTFGRQKKVVGGEIVISPGDDSKEMPFVVSGTLKVARKDKKGNEVFLYFIEGGETCAMSITCCLEGKKTSFHVQAEEETTLWMVPTHHIDSWVQRYPTFRKYVFDAYQTRFEELLETIDSVVFSKLDERLFKYLLDKKAASGSYIISKTHEQIAKELGTSRVVISRVLKQLEREGKIEQFRNRIDIL